MALGLLTSSKNIGRNKGNSNAKFAITPHWCSKVMVEQIRKMNMMRGGLRTPPHHVHQHSSSTSSRHGREGRRRTTGKKLGSAVRRGGS
jgi:hypothetical protein